MHAATPIQLLTITGMTCAGCANAVTRMLSRVPGVAQVRVMLETNRAEVAGTARPEDLLFAVRRGGYGAELLAP